jgi:hypothetical protein
MLPAAVLLVNQLERKPDSCQIVVTATFGVAPGVTPKAFFWCKFFLYQGVCFCSIVINL